MFLRKDNRCYDMNDMKWDHNMMKSNEYASSEKFKDMKIMKNDMCEDPMPGCKMQPVYECPVEKCVHRTICHEIPHVCPINTRVINHHVYRHTYAPYYTCCEENDACHVQEGSCCCFR